MNVVIILLFQNLGFVIGGQVLSGNSDASGKLQRKKERLNRNERNKSDGHYSDKRNEIEKWVVDSIFYDDYQSDAPSGKITSHDVCPPVPDVETDDACAKTSCQQDTDCLDEFRCCLNGCSFACLPEIKSAALVDWGKEPRRSRSGIAWLIEDPEIPNIQSITVKYIYLPIASGPVLIKRPEHKHIFEECSTSPMESDEDPLLCPPGYFCHVTEPGNPKKGKPNSGYCVKERDEKFSSDEKQLVLTSAFSETKTCKVNDILLLDGAAITLEQKHCHCKRGNLTCRRRSHKDKTNKKIKLKHGHNKKLRRTS